ncbi:MAG: spore coat U domain-containing protein [Nevskia sp.]|nr:spore coat U domain-containing protein [Nevskia sp.]
MPPAGTTTRTATFVVSVIVDNDCLLSSATDLDFGHARAHAVGGAKPQVAPSLQVTHLTVSCSKNTRFTLSLDKGNVPDSTIDRRLAAAGDPANTDRLQYQLYLDPSYSTVWGDASGVAGNVSGIGTGVVQTFTVYGRILPQERPNADSYSSIITASLTF